MSVSKSALVIALATAMVLKPMSEAVASPQGDAFSSKELASGTVNVTVSDDYLTAYLAMPFLGGEAFAPESGIGHPFVVTQVLTRTFAKEQLAQK